MGARNNDISLILAKAKREGFFPDVKDSEVDILEKEAKVLFSNDAGLGTFSRSDLNTFVTLGDSRTAYNGTVTVAASGETAVYTSDRGYVSWAMLMLRQRMKWLKNGGVGGDTVSQMLSRTDDLLSLNPGWIIGFGCVNSVTAYTTTEIIRDLSLIFDKAAANGTRVVWGTDWPGTSQAIDANRQKVYSVNDWLRTQVGVRPGFYLAEYQAIIVDPVTGNPIAANASDGLHQDGIGPRLMADQLFKILDPLVPKSDRLIASNDDKINLLPNGMFTGSVGGYATTWANNGTAAQAVATKVARTDGTPGEWQQLAITAGTDYQFRCRINAGFANSWVAGDTVYAECEFETDAAGWAPTEFNLNVNLFGLAVGTVIRAADMVHLNGVPNSTGRVSSGIFRTPPIYIPVGCTTVDVALQLKGTGTFRVARAALKRL